MFASMLASCWRRGPLDRDDPSELAPAMIDALASTSHPATLVLLAGLAAVAGEPAAERARQATGQLAGAGSIFADRLAEVGSARVVECWRMRHVLGDGDGYLFGCRYPGGAEHVLMVYVDHNLGTLVKDAFALDTSIAEMLADLRDFAGDDPDAVIEPVEGAEAAGRVREALELTDITVPPIETETYPAVRPLIDARLANLPAGFDVAPPDGRRTNAKPWSPSSWPRRKGAPGPDGRKATRSPITSSGSGLTTTLAGPCGGVPRWSRSFSSTGSPARSRPKRTWWRSCPR